MKKNRKRWLTTAVALALLVVFVPLAYAINYLGTGAATGNTENGLVSVPYTDVDNLFIYMMNQAMPVGTIYMTQGITTAAAMGTKYGGTWVAWGIGRTTAGVNPTGGTTNVLGATAYQATYPAQTHDAIGGTMNLSTNYPFAPTLTVGGAGLTINQGTMSSTPGGYTWTATPAINQWTGTVPGNSGAMATPNILHYHTITAPDINFAYVYHGENSFNALNTTMWGVTTSNPLPAQTAQNFSTTATLNMANYTLNTSGFPLTIYYTGPAHRYVPQYFTDSGGYTLAGNRFTATYSSASITVTDETVQPYVVVYMYKRLTLANLNP